MDPSLKLTRSALPAVSWSTFPEAVREGMELHLKFQGTPEGFQPVLVEEFPKTREGKFDTRFDVITWCVLKSERAGMDASGKQRKPNRPTLREVAPAEAKSGYSRIDLGWWENAIYQFTIHATSNKRANTLVEWFHRFLMLYLTLDFFTARGVQHMVFEERKEDEKIQQAGQEIYTRRLCYTVRLELLMSFESRNFETLRCGVGERPVQEFLVPSEV